MMNLQFMVFCKSLIILSLFGALLNGHHEHFQSYLDHRDYYMGYFNEMLNKKNDMYQSKHHVRLTDRI